MADTVTIQRPRRWDNPFDPEFGEQNVDRVMALEPFASMDESVFPPSAPLRDIVSHDMRFVRYGTGEIVIREGDYGTLAFLLISGDLSVVLPPGLPRDILGRAEVRHKGLFEALSQLWRIPNTQEARDPANFRESESSESRFLETDTARVIGGTGERGVQLVFQLPNAEEVLRDFSTVPIKPGDMFGEIAALTRATRLTSVIATSDVEVLQIRRQGIRDINRYVVAFREKLIELYRAHTLASHLQQTPLFSHLDEETIHKIADRTLFESYGDFDWHISFNRLAGESVQERLEQEPLIAEESNYPDGVLLIRSGFARLSQQINHGHRTISYVGVGGSYGLEEVVHNWQQKESGRFTLQHTLRSVGYTDILRVPTDVIERFVLPTLPGNRYPKPIDRRINNVPVLMNRRKTDTSTDGKKAGVPSPILESFVENRFINGTASMLIDLDRCVRCDACVEACAKGHNNNPRFIRHGQKIDHYMVANACMHCADPVCMIGCPTGAIHRIATTGEVVINDDTCIGCGTCASNCPYDNIRMVDVRDNSGNYIRDEATNLPIMKATKCDLCVDQLGGPACQRACPHDALTRIDLTDTKNIIDWMNR